MATGITQDAPASATVRARLLGEFTVHAGARSAGPWPRPSARRLCALLLVSPGRRVTRDLACEELFPRLEPRAAARSLSKALSMARAALAELGEEAEALLGADLAHVWLAPEIIVDADEQAAGLRAGLAMPPGQARDDAMSAALAGDAELLPGEPYAGWADRARDRLNALRQEARLARARDRAQGSGRSAPEDVTAAWLACLDHDPACEEAAAALISGYLAGGRPEQAVRVYERCRVAVEQLGLRTSPSLERVFAAALATDAPAPVARGGASVLAPSPFPAARAETPRTTPPARPPREERRPLTVLFAEVAATRAGLAGTLGLEELRDQVGGSLAAVIAEVEAMGGTVSSVSGRGLQAMFGAPEAHEDDPERALRAAYRALAVLGTGDGPGDATAAGPASRPGLRIGIESGPALVGLIGLIGGGAKVEYTALGDVVGVAAALQSAARPGSVLVGPATRAATAHLFSWGEREDVAPVPGARALSASYLGAPLVTAAERRPRFGGRAPLVGRQAELRMLDAAVRAAVDGRGQAIVLTGEPGIGKTRLMQETRNRFFGWVGAGSTRRPLWLEGRGTSYTSAVPYGLYRQMIAGWIGAGTDQPADAVRAALAQALIQLMGNSNLLDPLAHLMGVAAPAPTDPDPGRATGPGHRKIGPGEQQRQAFAAVRALVTRFTAMSPTVLLLEDLHWADPTSRRLTAELAELTASRPLLLLATARPGPGQPLAGPGRELRLRPLADAAARSLASALLGQVDRPEVLATALAGADGNPLFLEERLAEMLETGMLTRDSGQWRLRDAAPGPAGAVLLPQVLERLVRSRVDRLSPAAAEAIRAAAVLGTEFAADVLAGMLAMPPSALAPLLDELCDSDLVHPGHPDRAQSPFRFRHALIQEATYLALLRSERRDLHGRAARALEAAYECPPGEIAAVLGRHFEIAEASGQAVRYLELAGDDATDAFANDEAIALFQEALTVTARAADPGAAIRLNAKLANVLWRTARRDEAREAFQAALRLAAGPHQVDPVLRAHLYTRLGRLELSAMRFTEAAAAFDAADTLLALDAAQVVDPEQVDDATADQWLELTVDGRAELHAMRFEPDRALAVLDRAAPVLAARGGPARKTPFYRLCTTQKMLRNRLRVDQEDIASLRASAAEAEHTGEDKDVGYAQFFLGWVLWLRGDLDAADGELNRALALANRIGETHLRDLVLLTRCLTALRRHDAELVRTLLPQAFAARDNGGYPEGRSAGRLACAAWLAWQDDRPDEVIRLAGQIDGLDAGTLGSETKYRWVYLFPLIAARLRSGDIGAAATAAAQIIAPAQQWLPDDLTTALDRAHQSWDRGDPAQAADALTGALALARAHAYF